MEPPTIRYARANQDRSDTADSRNEPNSPLAAASTSEKTPPMSNCIALVSAGLAGVGTRLDMIVPVAHDAAAHKMITTPDADTPPWPPPRPDSRPTPASPIASPAACASPSLA